MVFTGTTHVNAIDNGLEKKSHSLFLLGTDECLVLFSTHEEI